MKRWISIHFGWPLDIFCNTMQKGLLAGCFHMCGNHVPSVAERKIHEFLQVFPQNPLIPTQCLGQPRFSRLFMVMSCQLFHFCYRSRMGHSRSQLKYFQWPFQVEIAGTYHKKKAYFLGLYDSRIAPKILGFIMIWCSTSVLGS